ncbi:hypothetical protein MES5069_50012 [Mesorhizobium escarrei]|uniref:Uncharacterized protein n=1 Tax=Mesorhizobium escarrei TaxID=666018 RepID=A0ABN8K8U1_9HYPH|nr:hypothetical protein MES5069_50012 [Mesorhizobium escarrei]
MSGQEIHPEKILGLHATIIEPAELVAVAASNVQNPALAERRPGPNVDQGFDCIAPLLGALLTAGAIVPPSSGPQVCDIGFLKPFNFIAGH